MNRVDKKNLALGIPSDEYDIITKQANDLLKGKPQELLKTSYEECKAYLDKDFLKKISPKHPEYQSRLWELFLCKILLCNEYKLIKKQDKLIKKQGDEGPDFEIKTQFGRIFIEAVSSSQGGTKMDIGEELKESKNVIDDNISIPRLLRLTSSLKEKKEKFLGRDNGKTAKYKEGYFDRGIVSKDDYIIIAVDGYESEGFWSEGIESVLYGLGGMCVTMNLQTSDTQCFYEERSSILKSNQSHVSCQFFKENPWVSAVLYSDNWNFSDIDHSNSSTMRLYHNPFADKKLPKNVFNFVSGDNELFVSTPPSNQTLEEPTKT